MLDQRRRRWSDVVQMLYKCFVFAGYCPADTTHWPSVDMVPGRRRRRWTGIESALGLCLLFAE